MASGWTARFDDETLTVFDAEGDVQAKLEIDEVGPHLAKVMEQNALLMISVKHAIKKLERGEVATKEFLQNILTLCGEE